MANEHKEFLRTGLGSIDRLKITGGSIAHNPMPKHHSKNQLCNVTKIDDDKVIIKSILETPEHESKVRPSHK